MRWAASALLGLAAVLVAAAPAAAQMQGALGKPLPAADLDPGTATVRVIAGTPDESVSGVEVVLADSDGNRRSARTNAEGRATFVGLQPGTTHVARVEVDDDETESEPFTVPEEGGVRLMLSTVPWKGDPDEGGAGAPPPRERSGIPLPDGQVQPGSLHIAVVQGDMTKPVEGAVVKLVGYDTGGGSTIQTQDTDAAGRVTFRPLRHDTVYYAMTVLERDGRHERLRSAPITSTPGVGHKMILSGATGKEPADDLGRMVEPQGNNPPGSGEVRVRLRGRVQGIDEVELLEVGQEAVVAKAPAAPARVDPSSVRGEVKGPMRDGQLPDRRLVVLVARMLGESPRPLGDVPIELVRLRQGAGDDGDAEQAEAEPVGEQRSPNNGFAIFDDLEPGETYQVVATVQGRRFKSEPFEMAAKGGMHMAVMTAWDADAALEARFTGLAAGDTTYVARVRAGGEVYRSAPFQLLPERGAALGIVVYDRLRFSFHMVSEVDDAYIGFQGNLVLHNPTWEPYEAPGGVKIPLPKGAKGAQVAERHEDEVKVVGDGFVWKGIVPPGQSKFLMGFSLEVEDGSVDFDMALPYGAHDSNINFVHAPGMQIEAPRKPELVKRGGTKFYSIAPINIEPNQRMVLSVKGLPHPPVWHRHVRNGVGLAVLASLLLAVFVALAPRRRRADERRALERDQLEQRRERLLDELVELEQRRGEHTEEEWTSARDSLRRELEDVYARLWKGSAGKAARST